MPNDDPHDSWHQPSSPLGQTWVRTWRKIYHPLGFSKGYNFPLFTIFAGALLGFVLSRLYFYDHDGTFLKSTIPTDALHYTSGLKRTGIIIHLASILPAGFLVCFQFVPAIRHKFILFHRLNGYLIILLFLLSNASAYMVMPTSAGGSIPTHVGLGLIATATTATILLAYYNIKRLQIDQHRAWMLRTWFYAGSIISLRLLMMAIRHFLTTHPSIQYYDAMSCAQIWGTYNLYGVPAPANPTSLLYPACTAPDSQQRVVVSIRGDGPENASAMAHLTFGAAMWLALTIHAVGVEIYLRLTPAESYRLRTVSYERQVEAGMRHPGRAGLTSDRLGDAPAFRPVVGEGRKLEEGS